MQLTVILLLGCSMKNLFSLVSVAVRHFHKWSIEEKNP